MAIEQLNFIGRIRANWHDPKTRPGKTIALGGTALVVASIFMSIVFFTGPVGWAIGLGAAGSGIAALCLGYAIYHLLKERRARNGSDQDTIPYPVNEPYIPRHRRPDASRRLTVDSPIKVA